MIPLSIIFTTSLSLSTGKRPSEDDMKKKDDAKETLQPFCDKKNLDLATCAEEIVNCPESCAEAGVSDCSVRKEAISEASNKAKEARQELKEAQEQSAESAKNFADAVQQWSEKKTENSQELKDSIQQATENANNAAR